jgi:predicted TIM-barrel fold metal-dependent hydrolase
VLIHNDVDMPFAREGAEPIYLSQMKSLLRRHPNATVIWAHVGLGRVVRPTQAPASVGPAERPVGYVAIIEEMLADPTLAHLHFDISWDEVAKYIVATPESLGRTADLLNRYPSRFLFGSDEVAPRDRDQYLNVYRQYEPLWALLTAEAREQVRKGNFERLFGAARTRVRAWEEVDAARRR